MNGVAQVTMPKQEARELYLEFRHHMNAKHCSPDDRAIAAGYKAMASGKAIIDLKETFRKLPLNEKKEPRLAVARSSWSRIEYGTYSRWRKGEAGIRFSQLRNNSSVDIPVPESIRNVIRGRGQVNVPIVPLPIRPQRWLLDQCLTLWEVENWEQPPTDPLLLRKLTSGSWLYVVLAQWDLTPLERMVLHGRLA